MAITLTPEAIGVEVVPAPVLRIPPGPIRPTPVTVVIAPLGPSTAGRVAAVPILPDPIVVRVKPLGPSFVRFVTPPKGTLQLAESHFRTMLSLSGAFQCWLGLVGAELALARIYYAALPRRGGAGPYLRGELERVRPFALIYSEPFRADHYATDIQYRYTHGGMMMLHLEQNIDADLLDDEFASEDRAEMHVRWQNTIGEILDDLENLSGRPGNLALGNLEMVEAWVRTSDDDVETLGHAQAVQLALGWELGQ